MWASSFTAMPPARAPEAQQSERLLREQIVGDRLLGQAKSHHVKMVLAPSPLNWAFWHTDEKWFTVT